MTQRMSYFYKEIKYKNDEFENSFKYFKLK